MNLKFHLCLKLIIYDSKGWYTASVPWAKIKNLLKQTVCLHGFVSAFWIFLSDYWTLPRTIPIENLLFDLFDTFSWFFYATDAVS